MNHTELNKGNLSGFLERYKEQLSKVKVRKAVTLFDIEPNFEWVKEGKCGVCGKGLKITTNGKIAYCGRKKCLARPPFVITIKRLYEMKVK